MNILILNWRDLANPHSGGAEVITEGIAQQLVKEGHAITLFTSTFPGAASAETIGGVNIIRQGSELTCRVFAFRYYLKHRHEFDLVIDEVNTLPFFTPFYVARKKRLVFFHQLCRNVWWYEKKFPVNLVGWLLEPLTLVPYFFTPALAMSESTKKDLRRFGLKARIAVLPEAIDMPSVPKAPKESDLTICFVGRLVRSKRPYDALAAFKNILAQVPAAKFWLVGTGPELEGLKKYVRKHDLERSVTVWGRVDEQQKYDLMQRSHFIVVTSVREGWGLIVSEAGYLGTPAVVYKVPGLVDSTDFGRAGTTSRANNPSALAAALLDVWNDQEKYARIQSSAKALAQGLTWENIVTVFKKNVIS